MKQRPVVLTPTHPLWEGFRERLEGPGGCDFRKEDGETKWYCPGGYDKPAAKVILETIPDIDVAKSLALFEQYGGHCDCEILFNVEAGYAASADGIAPSS